MREQLQEAIQRVVRGSRNEADIQAIAAALQAGQLTLVTGDGALGVSGNATNAILVTGSNNIIVRGEVAESLQAILERFSLNSPKAIASVDELVKQVRSRLHDDIQRLHGTMPLWSVDHWVPLGELFVDVNILEELSSSYRAELDDLWQDFTSGMQGYSGSRSLDRIGLGRERQRVSGLEVLVNNTNLMVVGKPGSGKTTYLQRVVTECNAGNLQAHRIPVLIKLREFIEDGRLLSYSLERYLERYWHLLAAETQLVLNQGRSLVLLDGLDEVTGADGRSLVKQIKQFARTYPQVQIIVTCRTQNQESRFERFDYVEVADFNEPQVRSFSEHWFKTVIRDEALGLEKSREFLEQLFREENKPIRELAITPILLSLTCAVFHQTSKFYSKRSKLYEEGLELLLEQWDKSREIERDEIYRDLSVERKLDLLSYLAAKKFEQEQYVLFEQAEIEEYIAEFLRIGLRESRGVLKAIEAQHGLLIERSRKVWSFSHLTFQEYCVARWFRDQTKWRSLVNHCIEKRWQEVFLLLVDVIILNLDHLLQLMKEQIDQFLATDKKLQDFLEWLEEKAKLTGAQYKLSAVRVFYFELLKSSNFELDNTFDSFYVLACILAVDLDLSHASISSHAYNIVFDLSFTDDRNYDHYWEGLNGVYDLALVNWQRYVSRLNLNAIQYLDPSLINSLAFNDDLEVSRKITHTHTQIVELEFEQKLRELGRILGEKTAFRHMFSSDKSETWMAVDAFERREDFKVWLEQLKSITVEHRNIQLNWQFGKDNRQSLERYYDANQFLIRCLKSYSGTHLKTIEEIEEALLLPIAEIEKRNREKAE